jgi:hypothetical protein
MRALFPLPAEDQLETISGTLQPVVRLTYLRSYNAFGTILTDENKLVPFYCPTLGEISCIYTTPYDKSPRLGKPITIKYLVVPGEQFPPFNAILEDRSGPIKERIEGQPEIIAMEATAPDQEGGTEVLSYDWSHAQLTQQYKSYWAK